LSAPPPFHRLHPASIQKILEAALESGARFAELFIERRLVRHVRLEESRL